jgi:6-pyruvoyl-tetrahydropterin synthase
MRLNKWNGHNVMNVNKWTKKLTKSLIEEQCKNNNLSEKETKEIMETLDHSLFIDNQGFKEKIPTIEKKIKESFSYKNNKTYTNATEFMDTPDHVEVFKKVLFDMLNNNELQVFYDNGVLNEGAIFLVYKINEKMIFEYMFCEDDTRRFLMNTEQILFSYPKETKNK